MKKERLIALLGKEVQRKEWFEKMERAIAWVDDGKGGCVDLIFEIAKSKVRIELLKQLISEYS